MRRYLLPIAMTFAAAGLAVPASAATYLFASPLVPEVPGATGSGQVSLSFDTDAHTLGITADWMGLSGTTSVAHIHCCVVAPGTVGVAVTPGTLPGFPTGVTAGSYSTLVDLSQAGSYTAGFLTTFGGGTVAGAEAALLAGLQGGMAYFNVHTTTYPAGEIRGFPNAVPEPGAWLMMLLGFGFVGGMLRLRRQTSVPRAASAGS